MSKPKWIGLAVLGCGAIFGLIWGGPLGLWLASGCLVVGLVLFVATEALGTKREPKKESLSSVQQETHIIVLLKEVHARPYRAGKFQEIRDPNEPGLQFEIFARCWLVNDTDEPLGIVSVSLSLAQPGGDPIVLQRISGDLENWRLGRLRDELDTWGVRYLHATEEPLAELTIAEPLGAGTTRDGWLHLRMEDITPAEMRGAVVTAEIVDSHLCSHVGSKKGPHQLPGRVWPFVPAGNAVAGGAAVAASSDPPTPSFGGAT